MSDNTLQALVDDLAEDLGRAVVLDDAELHLLCASRHYGDEDAQRIRAVLQRDVGFPATRHILSQGVTRWGSPGLIPADPELGMAARLCAPIRHRGLLLGLLLVIDADGTLTTEEIAQIERIATEIGAHQFASHLAVSEFRGARENAFRSLLSGEPTERESSIEYLHDTGWVHRPLEVHVTVLKVVEAPLQGPISVGAALRAALNDLNSASDRFGVVMDEESACVLQLSNRHCALDDVRRRAEQLLESLRQLLGSGSIAVAGIGGTGDGLEQAWRSYAQAQVAVRAAARVEQLAPVAVWDDLGSYAVTAQLPTAALAPALLPRPVQALLGEGEPEWLVETLGCYLDHAGSAPRTAAALHIHRTSLYYRLERIHEITGLDLDDGENRLLLHLGVRMIERRRGGRSN
jgi:hypothetical protein